MTRRMYSLFVALAASGMLIAGCGSSKPKPKAATTKPAATTTAPKTSATSTTSTTPSTPALSGATLKAAAAGCKSAEADDTTLNSTEKAYLGTICSDLAAGNVTAFKADVEKYCSALVAAAPAAEKAVAEAECKEVDKL
jgi:ABC-type glycerol-3-phosphate transport system substrate-binding protein